MEVKVIDVALTMNIQELETIIRVLEVCRDCPDDQRFNNLPGNIGTSGVDAMVKALTEFKRLSPTVPNSAYTLRPQQP